MATCPNDMIEAITEKIRSGEFQDDLQQFKKDSKEEKRTSHLLFLGRESSGKSALGNFLITGTSKGKSGPSSGTTEYIKTTEAGARYIIHDAQGIGNETTDVQEMEARLKKVYQDYKEDCIVIICVKQSDRITDRGIKQCFEICNSLDPNVWDNVIVAITHSEVPWEMRDEDNEFEMLEDLKTEWRAKVQETIEGFKVEREVPVCFTSHTKADRPIEDDWSQKLIKAIIQRSGQSESCFSFLFKALRATLGETHQAKSEMVKSHESLEASLCNIEDKVESTTEITAANPAYATMAIIGGVLGTGAGVAATLGTGIAGTSAGLAAGGAGGLTAAIAGAAAFGAVTIATSGVGALIGAGVGIGVAIAVVMVWLWIKRRRAQTNQ